MKDAKAIWSVDVCSHLLFSVQRKMSRKSNNKKAPPTKPVSKPKPIPRPKYTCLYAYDAQDTDELSFNEGDVIDLLAEGKILSTSADLCAYPSVFHSVVYVFVSGFTLLIEIMQCVVVMEVTYQIDVWRGVCPAVPSLIWKAK